MELNPYEELGIDEGADEVAIKAAFRKASKRLHPDMEGGSQDAFERIKLAYDILMDEDLRRQYDEDGVVGNTGPDNKEALARERVANFFVSSINAMVENPARMSLNDVDLVKGGVTYFNQQIAAAHQHVKRVEKSIAMFEKVLKRLKTKRKKDSIRQMLNSHIGVLKRNIDANKEEIKIHEMARDLIKDYTFDTDPDGPTQSQLRFDPYKGMVFK